MMKTYFLLLLILFLVLGCEAKKSIPPSEPLVMATSVHLGEVGLYSYFGLAANLSDLVYRLLFFQDIGDKFVFDLAKKLEWNEDKTKLKVFLKEPWAEDVVQSVKGALKRDIAAFNEGYRTLRGMRVLAPDVVEFDLKRFDRIFLYSFLSIRIARLGQKDESTGPFRLAKQSSKEIILERRVPSPRKINQIIVRQIDSPRRAIRELVAGNVNVVFLVNPSDFDVIQDLPEIGIATTDVYLMYVLLENRKKHHSSFWKEANRDFPREEFLKGQKYASFLKPAQVPVPDSLREKYGIKKKPSLTQPPLKPPQKNAEVRYLYYQTTISIDELLAKHVQRVLESWGQKVILRPLEPQEYENIVQKEKTFDLALVHWKISNPIEGNYIGLHSSAIEKGFNISSYSNPLLDQLLDKARYAWDEEEAEESFKIAMDYVLEDPPGIFLYWLQVPVLYRKNCSGFKINSLLFFSALKDMRCEPSAEN